MQEIRIDLATSAERDEVEERITAYNTGQVSFTQAQPFIPIDFVAKVQGKIIGGITAVLYCWKCLYINVLWVDEKYRGQGLGTALLRKVEEEAKSQGCHLLHLDTFDFQAKDFYLKLDYEIFGELTDCPPGHSRYFLKKQLR